jgi:anti-sigma factor ChrR (cupin superfamily)
MVKKQQSKGEQIDTHTTDTVETVDVLEQNMINQLNNAHIGITPLPLVKTRMHAQLFDKIKHQKQAIVPASTTARISAEEKSHLINTITVHKNEGEWIKIKAKVSIKPLSLDRAAGTRSFLMRLDAGAQWPAHEHSMDEECIVLQGGVSIGDLTITQGDYHLAPKGVRHEEFTSKQGALLFLRAGIEDTEPSIGVKANYVWQRLNQGLKNLF